ncbi:MAG: DoxX family protein [Phycisphaerales bacterium]
MKRYLSRMSATSPQATSLGLLVLRLVAGGFMAVGHGLGKLRGGNASAFPDPLGIGSTLSYYGAVTSEVLCASLVAAGLFTRLACLPLMFTMGVAALVVHGKDPLFMSGGTAKEPALIYLAMYVVILLCGPGRYSVDAGVLGRGSRP